MIEDVALAWERAGLDVHACFRRAVSVTGEWLYDPSREVRSRITQKPRRSGFVQKHRDLAETLNPQPVAAIVFGKLLDPRLVSYRARNAESQRILLYRTHRTHEQQQSLKDWIEMADQAGRHGEPKPPFCTREGEPIFPEEDPNWYLTEIQRKVRPEEEEAPRGDEDGPPSEEEAEDDPDAEMTDDEMTDVSDGDLTGVPGEPFKPSISWRVS